MFEYDNIQDFLSKSLIGKVIVSIGDIKLNEKIVNAWHDPSNNSLILYSETSSTFLYNDSFILVDRLIEIDWDNYRNNISPSFGYISPYVFRLEENEDYGDVMSTDEFYEHVKSGFIIDSDGHGYPSNGTEHIYLGVGVKDLAACKYSNTVSHVIWYNK